MLMTSLIFHRWVTSGKHGKADGEVWYWIMRMLDQKFLSSVDFYLFIIISQLFKYPSHTHFCATFSGKNVLYSVGNFDTVLIYQQNPNFTNCEPAVTFENCEHSISRFINWSIALLTISFIIVNVFPFLLAEFEYQWMYGAFRLYVYNIDVFWLLVYGQHRKILCCGKTYHSVLFSLSRQTLKRKFYVYLIVERLVLNRFLCNFIQIVV